MPVLSVNFFWIGSFSWSAQWRMFSSPELDRASFTSHGPIAKTEAARPRNAVRRLSALPVIRIRFDDEPSHSSRQAQTVWPARWRQSRAFRQTDLGRTATPFSPGAAAARPSFERGLTRTQGPTQLARQRQTTGVRTDVEKGDADRRGSLK